MRDLVAAPLAGLTLGPADSELVVAEWVDGPNGSSAERPVAPLHVHHGDDEAWYVLDGRLGFKLDERTVELDAGSAVVVPRGVTHTFWNASDGATRYLIVMTRRLERLIEELHETGFADAAATFRKYDSELVG